MSLFTIPMWFLLTEMEKQMKIENLFVTWQQRSAQSNMPISVSTITSGFSGLLTHSLFNSEGAHSKTTHFHAQPSIAGIRSPTLYSFSRFLPC